LAYDRVPKQNMILFDVDKGMEDYRGNAERFLEAERLSLECVPLLKEGTFDDWQTLKTLLDKQSILGGQTIEGFVIKGYGRYCDDGKLLMGKYVSEKFKEVHTKEWKKANPGGKDILGELADAYRSKSRWQKAVQHLRERGELTGSPQDIGALMKEVNEDVLVECGEEIRHRLFKWAWKHISRKVAAGLPEWYKEELAKQQFEEE